MRVLDVGSAPVTSPYCWPNWPAPGAGSSAWTPKAEILEMARVRVRAAGWTTVVCHAGDVMRLELEGTVDAVVGRWVLQDTPDPAALLRHARRWLRPGGIVAFQEIDLSSPARAYPTGPLHNQLMRWTTPPPATQAPIPRWDCSGSPPSWRPTSQHRSFAATLPLTAPAGRATPTWLRQSEAAFPSSSV